MARRPTNAQIQFALQRRQERPGQALDALALLDPGRFANRGDFTRGYDLSSAVDDPNAEAAALDILNLQGGPGGRYTDIRRQGDGFVADMQGPQRREGLLGGVKDFFLGQQQGTTTSEAMSAQELNQLFRRSRVGAQVAAGRGQDERARRGHRILARQRELSNEAVAALPRAEYLTADPNPQDFGGGLGDLDGLQGAPAPAPMRNEFTGEPEAASQEDIWGTDQWQGAQPNQNLQGMARLDAILAADEQAAAQEEDDAAAMADATGGGWRPPGGPRGPFASLGRVLPFGLGQEDAPEPEAAAAPAAEPAAAPAAQEPPPLRAKSEDGMEIDIPQPRSAVDVKMLVNKGYRIADYGPNQQSVNNVLQTLQERDISALKYVPDEIVHEAIMEIAYTLPEKDRMEAIDGLYKAAGLNPMGGGLDVESVSPADALKALNDAGNLDVDLATQRGQAHKRALEAAKYGLDYDEFGHKQDVDRANASIALGRLQLDQAEFQAEHGSLDSSKSGMGMNQLFKLKSEFFRSKGQDNPKLTEEGFQAERRNLLRKNLHDIPESEIGTPAYLRLVGEGIEAAFQDASDDFMSGFWFSTTDVPGTGDGFLSEGTPWAATPPIDSIAMTPDGKHFVWRQPGRGAAPYDAKVTPRKMAEYIGADEVKRQLERLRPK